MSHDAAGVDTFGLVLHPTKPVDESVRTITAWARSHSARVLAREPDRGRVKLSLLDLPLRQDQLLELIPESLRQQAIEAAAANEARAAG